MDFSHWFLVLCAVVVFYNLGMAWFAQVVIYPLFGQVGSAEYRAYHLFKATINFCEMQTLMIATWL